MSTYTEALRNLADFIDDNPELNIGTGWDQVRLNAMGSELNIHLPLEGQKDSARALRRALGGVWGKTHNGNSLYLDQSGIFGFFDTTVFLDRNATCERKVVGTEDVVMPAVEAQEERIETRDIVEWDCGNLLEDAPAKRELVDA